MDRVALVQLFKRPKLRSPYMVAAWPGMGGVAIIAANYLRQQLEAEEFGAIDSHHFFSPAQVLIKDYLIQTPELPDSKFYSWAGAQEHDLVIFVGNSQAERGYEFAHCVLDVAEEFQVGRIYTFAAFPLFIHHSRQPGVWGAATDPELIDYLKGYRVQLMENGTIGGLNGLLLGVAKERRIGGVCLLGEIPIYATQIVNPRASQAVLQVLMEMLDIPINLDELAAWADKLEPEMDKLYQALPEDMREAIDRFESLATYLRPAETEANRDLFEEIEDFLEEQRRKGKGDQA
jgi:proteasome assembly chaperone (PAC2) family protein